MTMLSGFPESSHIRHHFRRVSGRPALSGRRLTRRRLAFELLETRRLLAISIDIDYSLDTNGFFADPTRRDLLQIAADSLAVRFQDDLAATPVRGPGDWWSLTFFHPGTGLNHTLNNPEFSADTVVIYAGGHDLGGVPGIGGTSGPSVGGTPSFVDTIVSRGEAGVPTTDFGPWAGSVTFDTSTNWHFGETTSGLEGNEFDFLSVAEHEIAHSLGFGTSSSWSNFVSGSNFTGPASVAQFGGNVPLSPGQGHWADGTLDPLSGQETAMDPIITDGTRKLFTELDFAGLDDLGWDVRSTNLFVVNSVGDGGESNPGNGLCDDGTGNCTLRAAIEEANARSNLPAGADVISFDISGVGPHTIQPGSALPTVTEAVVIDGTTEPDFAGTPVVELDGSSLGGGADGLQITAGNSTVGALAILGFPGDGLDLRTAGGNTIVGNHIGTDSTGTADLGNGRRGVFINGVDNNVIGGVGTSDGNVISGNDEYGVLILGGGTGNRIEGNRIGTTAAGTAALANAPHGVYIANSPGNTIGGTAARAGNVISGNSGYGVWIYGAAATGNVVAGNLVGTNQAGTSAVANGVMGVRIEEAAGNTIGGLTAAARNVISGSGKHGLGIFRGAAGGNTVQGNYIGTDATGSSAIPNTVQGIQVFDSPANQIGGTSSGAGNVISGNGAHGVQVRGLSGTNNVIEGNFIGTDAAGTATLGNGLQGIIVSGGTNTRIGGTATGAGNVIGGNGQHGVWLVTSLSDNNVVEGNFIGTDSSGTLDLGNGSYGVVVSNGANNRIGGAAAGAGNTIANNGSPGVAILKTTTGNIISRNSIFDNAGRGIDLGGDGYTPNDTAAGDEDADGGVGAPNNLQNFPAISSAVLSGGNLDVTYSVPSTTANSAYDLTVEFFIADSNGQEGKTYLDDDTYPSASATLPRSATISAGAAQVGDELIATATDANGNTSEFSFTRTVSSPLLAAGGEAGQESRLEDQELRADDLLPIVDVAIDLLVGAGFAAESFSSVAVAIADLPDGTLGLATGSTITIDVDAAGYGWYVSPELRVQSPEPVDSDAASGSRLSTLDSQLRMDLFSVVMHELGHTAGLEDLYDVESEDDLMYAWLEAGERRTPNEAAVDRLFESFK